MDGRAVTKTLVAAVAKSTTGNGTGVDLQGILELGNKRHVMAHLSVGAQSGTTPTLSVKIQESDDNSTYTDITGAVFTQVGAALSEQDLFTQIRKRYARAVWTLGGTTPNYTICVTLVALKTVTS